MKRLFSALMVGVLWLAGPNCANATDAFQSPLGDFEIGVNDAQTNGIGPIWGIFDSGANRFRIYRIVGCVETLVAEDDDLIFDSIDQYSWNDADYLGWQIGLYSLRAYDGFLNELDDVLITVYDDSPPMM